EATRALRAVAERHEGQLIDALLAAETDFTVRRRIPAVLAACRTPRAVAGLALGLSDHRFEVRYRCARALSGLLEADPDLRVESETILAAVRREAKLGQGVWNSQNLLDPDDAAPDNPVDAFVKRRASRSLAHVFTLL